MYSPLELGAGGRVWGRSSSQTLEEFWPMPCYYLYCHFTVLLNYLGAGLEASEEFWPRNFGLLLPIHQPIYSYLYIPTYMFSSIILSEKIYDVIYVVLVVC